MRCTKEQVLDFIDHSITELAAADTPFFKQVKAIFKIVTAGSRLLRGVRPDDPFKNFVEILKCELKELAKQTDNEQMMKMTNRLQVLISDKKYPLSIYSRIRQKNIGKKPTRVLSRTSSSSARSTTLQSSSTR